MEHATIRVVKVEQAGRGIRRHISSRIVSFMPTSVAALGAFLSCIRWRLSSPSSPYWRGMWCVRPERLPIWRRSRGRMDRVMRRAPEVGDRIAIKAPNSCELELDAASQRLVVEYLGHGGADLPTRIGLSIVLTGRFGQLGEWR